MADAQAIAAAGRPVRSPRSGDGRVATDEGLFAPASIERWDRDPAAFSALAGAAVDWWEAELGRGLAWRELLNAENDGRQ